MSNIYNAIQNLYNMDKTTWQEVLAELYNLVSNVENKFDLFENKFGQLLGKEVTKELKKMYDDGSLGSLINDKLLKDIKTEVSEQLDNIENYTTSIEYNLINKGFKFDGSDESELFQSFMPKNSDERVTIILPHGRTIKVKNIYFNGFLTIKGNFCKFTGDNPEDFVFVTNTRENLNVLYAENLYFKNICFAKFHMDGDIASTRRIYAKNIWADSMNQKGNLIDCRSCDFINLENVQAYSYNTIININSEFNKTPRDRMNTQIRLKNISGGQSNYGIILNGVDKLSIDGVDFGKVKTGLIINMWCRRLSIKNYHCETYGYYENTTSKDGYGIYISNRQYNVENCIEESSLFLPSTYAKGGLYMPDDTSNNENTNQFIFRNVTIDDKENDETFLRLKLSGNYKWIGKFDYTSKVNLGSNGSKTTLLNGCIEPSYCNYNSRNLLSIDKITGTESFARVTGDLSVTKNSDIIKFNNNSGTKVDCILEFTPSSIGWYTFLFNGNLKTTSNIITVMLDNPPYTTAFSSTCIPYYNYSTNKIYFYVSNTVKHRIQFKIENNSSIELNGDIGLYKGFKNTF